MPYEDVLPSPDFAVHIREHALFRLPEVLDAIISTEGQVRVYMNSLSCVKTFLSKCLWQIRNSNAGSHHSCCAAASTDRRLTIAHAGEAHADQCELRLEVLHMAGPTGQSAGCPPLFLAPENDRGKAHTIHGLEHLHTALRCTLRSPPPPAPDASIWWNWDHLSVLTNTAQLLVHL